MELAFAISRDDGEGGMHIFRIVEDGVGVLVSYFSASGNALLSGPKILLGGRTDGQQDRRPSCNLQHIRTT